MRQTKLRLRWKRSRSDPHPRLLLILQGLVSGQLKSHLPQTKSCLRQTKSRLPQTNSCLRQTKCRKGQTKPLLGKTKSRLGQTNPRLRQTKPRWRGNRFHS